MHFDPPPDMMPLSEAVAIAHREVFSGTVLSTEEAMDVIATALSGHFAIHGQRDFETGLSQLTEEDYSRGGFRGGAMRFEFRDGGSPVVHLCVRKADLTRVLGTLTGPRGDPIIRR
jgi:hypothetical protein